MARRTDDTRRTRGAAPLEARAKALASAVLCARTEARQFLAAGGESVAAGSKAAVSLASFTGLPLDVVNRLAEAAARPSAELRPASARPAVDVDDPSTAADLDVLASRWAQVAEQVLVHLPWLEVVSRPEAAAVLLGCTPNQAARFFAQPSGSARLVAASTRPSASIAVTRRARSGKRPRPEWSFDPDSAPVRGRLKASARSDDTARRLCEASSALDRVPWIASSVVGDAHQLARVIGLGPAELDRLLA